MNNKIKETLAWVIVLAVVQTVLLIITIVALVNTSNELAKHKAILDVACDYSGNKASCKAGLELLKNMDVKDIKDFGL